MKEKEDVKDKKVPELQKKPKRGTICTDFLVKILMMFKIV